MKKIVLSLLSILFVGAGCSISFTSSRLKDGGVFRSTTFGEQWEQKVLVSQEKKRSVTISNEDITGLYFSPASPEEITVTTLEHGIYRTANNGDIWTKVNVTDGQYPTFAYDPSNPSVQYTATGATIVKTVDNAAAWETVYTESTGQRITALAVDRYDTSRVYAGTSSGVVLRSDNYGVDWSVLYQAGNSLRSIIIRPDDTRTVFLVTSSDGLFRTTNAGQDWTHLREALSPFSHANEALQLLVSPFHNSTLYYASKHGLLRSTNNGDTWEEIKTLVQPNTLPVWTVALDSGNPSILYFSVNDLIHKSEDNGLTWKTIETVPTNRLIARMAPHPSRPGELFVGAFLVK